MFGMISTKDLYVVKLDVVTDYKQLNLFEGKYKLSGNARFTIAKKVSSNYIDIFTGTKYSDTVFPSEEIVVQSRAILTYKKYITKKEINILLQEINRAYLENKKLVKSINKI